ncbi:MAG: DUF1573 domain-containing protein, partial [Verrucomicrobiota bacterium]
IYVWFPPSSEAKGETLVPAFDEKVSIVEARLKSGDLIFEPAFQVYLAEAGQREVEVSFSVINSGNESAKMKRLVSGCECLLVEIDQDPIPAGATATVKGIFDTEKLRGQSERKITIEFEGLRRPVFLTTRIETEPVYTITEEMTSWEIGSDVATKTVEFRVVRDEPVRVLSAESKRKEMSCELVVVEEGRAYDLLLTPDSTNGSLLGIVSLETDCEIESYARPLAYFSIQ